MKVRIQTPPNPDLGRMTFYVDQAKAPRQKNPAGSVQSTAGLSGAPISLVESSAPAPDEGGAWVYSKDVGGVTELFVMDGDGNEIQITNNGALNAGGAVSGQFWPTQVGRTSFDSGPTPVSNAFTIPTGIILAPAPGQASLVHFRAIVLSASTASPGFRHAVGWIAFQDIPGTPDARVNAAFVTAGATALLPGGPVGDIGLVDFNPDPLAVGYGVSVLNTGEMVLHMYAPPGDNFVVGSIAVTEMSLPANLLEEET